MVTLNLQPSPHVALPHLGEGRIQLSSSLAHEDLKKPDYDHTKAIGIRKKIAKSFILRKQHIFKIINCVKTSKRPKGNNEKGGSNGESKAGVAQTNRMGEGLLTLRMLGKTMLETYYVISLIYTYFIYYKLHLCVCVCIYSI